MSDEIGWQHIYPLNDDREHLTEFPEGEICHCKPRIDWDDRIVIHNAYDYREILEELDECCDA